MNLQQQFFEPQLSPSNIHLRSFHTQRFTTEPKDIGPWNSQAKRPSPRQLRNFKTQSTTTTSKIKKKDNNLTVHLENNLSQQIVLMRKFKTHVFEFIDQSKVSDVRTLQKQKKPYTFRQFQLSSFLPEQREGNSKNPMEPMFISLLKYKKQKLKNRMKQIACRLTNNKSKSMHIPSISNRQLFEGKSRIVSLSYQKVNFKITTKAQKFAK